MLRRVRRALAGFALLAPTVAFGCFPDRADLVVVNGGDAALLDPHLGSSAAEARVALALHAGLTRLAPATLAPLPDLAEDFRSEDGERRWIFLLRPGLTWSDGSPLGAEDFRASWERLRLPATGAPYASWLDGAVIEIRPRADGREEIVVEFPGARPMFAEMTALWPLAPVHATLRAAAPGTLPAPLVTAGPYLLVRRAVRDRIRVARNPHFWRAESVALGSLDFLAVESQFTALNLFLAGEADYVPSVPRLAVPRLLVEHADAFRPSPQYAALFLRVNLHHPLLADRDLRCALARALDRTALAEALGGVRQPAERLVPPLPGAPRLPVPPPTAAPFGFAPQAARAHLAAARRRLAASGQDAERALASLELLVPSSEFNRDLAAALREQWQTHLGLSVRILALEGREARAAERAGEFALSRSSWVGDYLDAETFLAPFRGASPGNRTGFADPRYDACLDAAATARDAAERAAQLARAERILLEEVAVIPLLTDANLELVAPDLRGFFPNPRGHVDWSALARQR
jgi:oligopeptide transport system substrate-binding protein